MLHFIMDDKLLLIGEERKLKIMMNPEVLVVYIRYALPYLHLWILEGKMG